MSERLGEKRGVPGQTAHQTWATAITLRGSEQIANATVT